MNPKILFSCIVCCLILATAFLFIPNAYAEVPKVYSEIKLDSEGKLFLEKASGERCPMVQGPAIYTAEQFTQRITGTANGLSFDFSSAPLFNLDAKYAKELDATMHKDIKALFRKQGVGLGKIDIVKVAPGKEWLVQDKDQSLTYHIKATADSLTVNVPLDGILYYGLIKPDEKYPYPVFFRRVSTITNGKTSIDITKIGDKFDFVGWQKSGFGIIGYRVIRHDGQFLYDGKISFRGTGPFQVGTSIIVGPFVHQIEPTGLIISLTTNKPVSVLISLSNGKIYSSSVGTKHEIPVSGLEPDQTYEYTVQAEDYAETYSFKTAPLPGTRKSFTFAYASDCRAGQGGGERSIFGMNAYILKKVLAITMAKKAAFFQFTGDFIDGYNDNANTSLLQYQNWQRAAEPFAHYLPIYAGMGNHEVLVHRFDDQGPYGIQLDKFPFATDSTEALFAKVFVNPTNGPTSEDGAVYDPDPNTIDFPSYMENVYSYTYDNVAMIVLNSNYWYNPSLRHGDNLSGNLHGYLMDRQIEWLTEALAKYQENPNIDWIFVTAHTPALPNGGHKGDAMWYDGDNHCRSIVAGKPVPKGIIERRDELLTLLMKHTKVVAFLAGDEHNYNRMLLTKDDPIYPKDWTGPKITEASYFRNLWQITNGAAGAPYAAQESMPWTGSVKFFTTYPTIVFFHIQGKSVKLEAVNPDTLDTIDQEQLY